MWGAGLLRSPPALSVWRPISDVTREPPGLHPTSCHFIYLANDFSRPGLYLATPSYFHQIGRMSSPGGVSPLLEYSLPPRTRCNHRSLTVPFPLPAPPLPLGSLFFQGNRLSTFLLSSPLCNRKLWDIQTKKGENKRKDEKRGIAKASGDHHVSRVGGTS